MTTLSGEGLTARQFETLKVIAAFIEERGISPSLAEIGERLGTPNKGNIQRILTVLRERGRIKWRDGCSRSISLVKQPSQECGRQIVSWLRVQAAAEEDPAARAALAMAHNAALAIVEGRDWVRIGTDLRDIGMPLPREGFRADEPLSADGGGVFTIRKLDFDR